MGNFRGRTVGKLRIQASVKQGRGMGTDPNDIIEAIVESWDELQEGLEGLPEQEQEEIKEYFNTAIEGEDDLGEMFFGDSQDF